MGKILQHGRSNQYCIKIRRALETQVKDILVRFDKCLRHRWKKIFQWDLTSGWDTGWRCFSEIRRVLETQGKMFQRDSTNAWDTGGRYFSEIRRVLETQVKDISVRFDKCSRPRWKIFLWDSTIAWDTGGRYFCEIRQMLATQMKDNSSLTLTAIRKSSHYVNKIMLWITHYNPSIIWSQKLLNVFFGVFFFHKWYWSTENAFRVLGASHSLLYFSILTRYNKR